jgi:hypothetical protein
MFFLFLLIAVLTSNNLAASEEWVPFNPGNLEGYPEINLILSSANELVFEIKFPGMKAGKVEKQGMVYDALFIPGGGRTQNVGWSELPTWSRFIAVPQGATPQVEVVSYSSEILTGFNPYPAQELAVDLIGAPEPGFKKDEEFYRKDQFFPERLAFAGESKVIRGCNVSSLTLFPVLHNPGRGELRVISDMQIKISFPGGSNTFIDPRLRSPYFESLFQNLMVNYSALEAPPSATGMSETGCDFLIITHPDFQVWAESLAFWKNLSGIPTWVRNTTQTGSTTESILAFLEDAYNNWTPPPSFLLLIGDAEFIPLFYENKHPYDKLMTGTDLYYATLDGQDYFPDLFHGRITVDSASQAGTVISKILQYERSPLTTPSTFYDNALAAGYFQDDDLNGYEDRFFLITSEVLRDFLIDQPGKDVERCYVKTLGSIPCCYYYGDPIPPGLVWTGSNTQISNAINNGVFLVTHRDHGSISGWGDPTYYVVDINLLTNGSRLPVVLSVNCETGHFDNETDSPGHNTLLSTVCFCEAFQRKTNGGAVGVMGHTRVSWSGLNDELAKGLYDAIWPDFDPSYPGSGSTQPIYSPMYRMGAMLNFGKFWMYDKYYLTGGEGYPWGTDQRSTETTFEMGTWFGDPTMQIWTELPEPLDVSHPDNVLLGEYSFSVAASSGSAPVESVLVCLMNDEVYQIGYTDATGEAAFTCTTTVESQLHLTATKHNFRPYQGTLNVAEILVVWGDANGDGFINLSDAIYLLNYLFKSDSPPDPLEAGDANCDENVNLSDAIYLLNYLFKNGPAPGCG